MRPGSPANCFLICCGNALDPATHGGLPTALLQAGAAQGLLHGGLALQPHRLRWQRRSWNLRQLLFTGRPGGFQYTPGFNLALLAQAGLDPSQPLQLLSIYPFLPTHPWPDRWQVAFYIDTTTRQVFGEYGSGERIAASLQQQALHSEQRAYSQAIAVICRSQWAADSVINDYGIQPAKVHVVPGGANLDEALLAGVSPAQDPPPPSQERQLRLGFLGKEWQRKGGPFLLQLAEALGESGIPTVIRAIGPDPARLPLHPALQPLGFFNKQNETARFVAELQSWHFGTLFEVVWFFWTAPIVNL